MELVVWVDEARGSEDRDGMGMLEGCVRRTCEVLASRAKGVREVGVDVCLVSSGLGVRERREEGEEEALLDIIRRSIKVGNVSRRKAVW